MEKYIIKGGNPLKGEVHISGAKNAALGILAAAVMTDEPVTIENMPMVRDTNVIIQAVRSVGAGVTFKDKNVLEIDGSTINSVDIQYEQVKRIRASYYLLGAFLGKYKEAKVALPGGCDIGSRPIDMHIKGFKALGAEVDIIEGGIVWARADKLTGAHIYFDMVSVGATINLMMAACMADGETILENAAKEPHIVDVANLLNAMGAKIKGAGTDVIRIKGVKQLHAVTYPIIPDQIEAGTFMVAAAITGGDITVCDVIPKHLESISAKLIEMGCEIEEADDSVRVISKGRLHSTNIKTLPYPGFPTDMQPQFAAALSLAEGTSIVTEGVFDNRFRYVDELARMGGKGNLEGNIFFINGVDKLMGAELCAPDLRAGAALVLAALAADGFSEIEDIHLIQRGYEDFDGKIRSLGGNIEIISNEHDAQKFKLKVG